MSAMDRHVSAVQNKLALGHFLRAMAWGCLVIAGAALVAVAADRLFSWKLPMPWWLAGIAVVVAGGVAIVWALAHRPAREAAAMAIDQRLELKEKFSTALYARPGAADPFAAAVVKDAEQTALCVQLRRQFPIAMPKATYGAVALVILALLTWRLSPMDLLGRKAQAQKELDHRIAAQQAQKQVADALEMVTALAKTSAATEDLKNLQGDLTGILETPITDPDQANRKAIEALAQVSRDSAPGADQARRVAAQMAQNLYNNIGATSEKGAVADMQRNIRKEDLEAVQKNLDDLGQEFDKMTEQEKEQAAAQMANLAQQLQNAANDPQTEKKIEDALQQQLGINKQAAQQMAQTMQQAANGDAKAQQQMQQAAQQAMRQMNGGKGPNAQQRQQIQQALNQMQGQANSQAQVNALSQAAQQLAGAMQQQCQGGSGSQPSALGQQPGQQGAGTKQPGQQQAGQQGGQQGGQGQMADAAKAMSEAVSEMQAGQQEAAQLGNIQQTAAMAQGQPDGGANQNGQAGGWGQQGGPWSAGQPDQQQGAGPPGGPGGVGTGPRDKAVAPYTVAQEYSPSETNEKGVILARSLVKDNRPAEKGDAKVTFSKVVTAAQQEATDDVDNEHVSGAARKAAEKYFQTMQQEPAQP